MVKVEVEPTIMTERVQPTVPVGKWINNCERHSGLSTTELSDSKFGLRLEGLEIDLADIRTIVEHQGELIKSQGALIKDQHAQLKRLREEEQARARASEEMQHEHEERGRQHSSWRRLAENIWEVARMLPDNGKGTETVSYF